MIHFLGDFHPERVTEKLRLRTASLASGTLSVFESVDLSVPALRLEYRLDKNESSDYFELVVGSESASKELIVDTLDALFFQLLDHLNDHRSLPQGSLRYHGHEFVVWVELRKPELEARANAYLK